MASGIVITPKALWSAVGVVLLALTSWLCTTVIGNGNRLARLEQSDLNDERQDAELVELRGTIRDLIQVTAELAGNHAVMGPVALSAEDHAHPAEEGEPELTEEYEDFRAEQMDLEALLRSTGGEPAMKRGFEVPSDSGN